MVVRFCYYASSDSPVTATLDLGEISGLPFTVWDTTNVGYDLTCLNGTSSTKSYDMMTSASITTAAATDQISLVPTYNPPGGAETQYYHWTIYLVKA